MPLKAERMTTTANANLLIWPNILRRSQVLACCSSRAENTYKVATIRLLLKFQVTPDEAGGNESVLQNSATRSGAPVPRPARQPALLVERKNHVNGGVNLDGITIEKSRLIAPLPDSIQRGLLQQGMAVQNFELLNRAVLTDDRVQTHGARDARLTSERRINRLNTVDDTRCLDVAAYAKRASQPRLRWGRRTTHATDDATEHAAHGAAGNAARNATAHASGHIRLGVFLNNLNFLRDDFRRHQLAGIHQVSLRLDVDDLSNRRRRWWWRWRRRRGEHSGHHGLGKRIGVNQSNENQNQKKEALARHRNQDCPRLVCLLGIRARNHHFFKHGSYLLPAGARRPETFSLPRALLPAAGAVPAATPRPRQ